VICYELQSLDNAKHLNIDGLKSLITHRKFNIESKYLNIRTIDNVSNFIFVSNNYRPIKIENDDRRYIVFKCSDIYKNKFEYFDKLNNTFRYDFYISLFRCFLKFDISFFNTRIIPLTDMKYEIMEACKESSLLFLEDNRDNFKDKYNVKNAYKDYIEFYDSGKYQPFSKKIFRLRLFSLVDERRTTIDKKLLDFML
jgi:hypothetical protein